jgi:hypothetical protein
MQSRSFRIDAAGDVKNTSKLQKPKLKGQELAGEWSSVDTAATAKLSQLDTLSPDRVMSPLPNQKDRVIKVAFTDIEFREYPIIVGDSPSTLVGIPITIGWEHVNKFEVTVDEYESIKPEARGMAELRVPSAVREDMLKNLGFTLQERQRGMKAATIGRKQRKFTDKAYNFLKLQESLETARRATANATFGRSRKRRERELLKRYQKKEM